MREATEGSSADIIHILYLISLTTQISHVRILTLRHIHQDISLINSNMVIDFHGRKHQFASHLEHLSEISTNRWQLENQA